MYQAQNDELQKNAGKYRRAMLIRNVVTIIVLLALIIIPLLIFPNDILGNRVQRGEYEEKQERVEGRREELASRSSLESQEGMKTAELLTEIKKKVSILKQEQIVKRQELKKLDQSYLSLIENYKVTYKAARRKRWRELQGQTVPSLCLKGKGPLKDVTIREITADSIRLKRGISYRSIRAAELCNSVKEDYMLGRSSLEMLMEKQGNASFSLGK